MKQILNISFLVVLILTFSVFSFGQNDNSDNSEKANEDCFVILQVEFLKTGKVGKVSLVEDSCSDKSLCKEAIEAAKKVKFEPAKKDGKRITVVKKVKYTFESFADEKNTKSVNSNINKPLKILYKPKPAYPSQENGTICIQGTVMLRVEFLATGEIGKIDTFKGLTDGLTENAIEAAKKIKFEPEIKNGIAITIIKTIPFSFTIY